jgi:hypothetical protein
MVTIRIGIGCMIGYGSGSGNGTGLETTLDMIKDDAVDNLLRSTTWCWLVALLRHSIR